MRLGISLFVVIGVVGGKILYPVFVGPFEEHFVDFVLFRDSMTIELNVKIIPKLLFPPDKSFLCLGFSHIEDEVGDLSPNTSGAGYQVSLELYK